MSDTGLGAPLFHPTPPVVAVLERAARIAYRDRTHPAGHVTVGHLARALVDLHPAAVSDALDSPVSRLYDRIGLTNDLLGRLNTTIQEAIASMATLDDLKAAADQLAANEAALATEVGSLSSAVERLVVVVGDLRSSGGLTPAQQAELDAAVEEVTTASADLATQTGGLATEEQHATDAANPPPPVPQG